MRFDIGIFPERTFHETGSLSKGLSPSQLGLAQRYAEGRKGSLKFVRNAADPVLQVFVAKVNQIDQGESPLVSVG